MHVNSKNDKKKEKNGEKHVVIKLLSFFIISIM